MEDEEVKHEVQTGSKVRTWAMRLGAGAFLFFLIKGLLWLIVPAVLVWWTTAS